MKYSKRGAKRMEWKVVGESCGRAGKFEYEAQVRASIGFMN